MAHTGSTFPNPFRPGAGHPPPYLAGRGEEKKIFDKMLDQDVILENLVLTGLRGVGKTVLFDTFKPLAQSKGWLWVGTDLSESTSISEEAIATRLLADVATATSSIPVGRIPSRPIGFGATERVQEVTLTYNALKSVYDGTPGLIADKLKAVLELAWTALASLPSTRGIVFAYDEAQNLADQAQANQFPLSLLLDVFQSLQKKGVRFMLALTGLPTLFPKLVEARTFAERMFRVVFLSKLSDSDSRDAILKPISDTACPVRLAEPSVALIVRTSGGYPYFIQFICREVYDVFIANISTGKPGAVPMDAIVRRLDSDFFAGRWARVTDRQRELLLVVAKLDCGDDEFSVQDVVEQSKQALEKPFGASHVSQMLASLAAAGLIYKNRHGKYSFAVPLFGEFVVRQMSQ
jgi:hypothetical protein